MAQQPPSLPPQRPRPSLATLLDDEEAKSSRTIQQLEPHARDRAVLTQTAGLEAGRVCTLEGRGVVTLGRAPDCTHMFDEASLSRVHARISRTPEGWVIEDAQSRNGVFVNDERTPLAVLNDGDRVRLGSAITLRFQMVDAQEEEALTRVFESSVRDGLTGAWNRKYLDERLRGEVAFATRHRSPLTVVLLDIDHFKRVNDTFGHLVGDRVLKETAATLRGALRTEDLLARYGGEEFVVLARNVDLKSGAQLAERLRIMVERKPVRVDEDTIARTISAGVASLECCGAEPTATTLLGLADERLYRAKQGGRNRIVAA